MLITFVDERRRAVLCGGEANQRMGYLPAVGSLMEMNEGRFRVCDEPLVNRRMVNWDGRLEWGVEVVLHRVDGWCVPAPEFASPVERIELPVAAVVAEPEPVWVETPKPAKSTRRPKRKRR